MDMVVTAVLIMNVVASLVRLFGDIVVELDFGVGDRGR